MLKNKSIWAVSVLTSALVLSACQPKSDQKEQQKVDGTSASEAAQPSLTLEGTMQSVPFTMPSCEGKQCPEFSIDRLQTNQFVLDSIVDQAIRDQLQKILELSDPEAKQAREQIDQASASEANFNRSAAQLLGQQVQPYVNKFIDLDKELKSLGASSQISLSISPKILNSQEPVATVVLNSSSYMGGAHGSSAQTYYNFDLKNQKQISLDQIIEPNQKQKLYDLAHQEFKTWVIESKLAENVDEYEQAWKFFLSTNYYLGKKGLILQYAEYEIGPFVVGLPRLTIPYEQLKGIIKTEYLPAEIQAVISESKATEAAPVAKPKA